MVNLIFETFDDAKAPSKFSWRLNKGWTVVKRLLEHERTMISLWDYLAEVMEVKNKMGLARLGKYAGIDSDKKLLIKHLKKSRIARSKQGHLVTMQR